MNHRNHENKLWTERKCEESCRFSLAPRTEESVATEEVNRRSPVLVRLRQTFFAQGQGLDSRPRSKSTVEKNQTLAVAVE